MAKLWAKAFYKSDAWQSCRLGYIAERKRTDLLPQTVLDYAKKHFSNQKATARAVAQYQYLILEGKTNE